jgi:hypothetical protein
MKTNQNLQNKNQQNQPRNIKDLIADLMQNPDRLADFFKFQGKFFKQDLRTINAVFASNPNAELIADKAKWEKFGCKIKDGELPNSATQKDGSVREVYDLSQIEGAKPNVWEVSKNAITAVQKSLNTADKLADIVKKMCYEKIGEVDKISEILGISNEDLFAFRASFQSAMCLAVSGRLEVVNGDNNAKNPNYEHNFEQTFNNFAPRFISQNNDVFGMMIFLNAVYENSASIIKNIENII